METFEETFKMDAMLKPLKIGLIVLLVVIVTFLHYSTIHGKLGLHIPHRELYFLPILLATYWFGLSFGLVTSLAVSLIYAPHVFIHDENVTQAVQINVAL